MRDAEINVAAVYHAGSAAGVPRYSKFAAVDTVLFQQVIQQQKSAGALLKAVAVYAGLPRFRYQVVEVLRAHCGIFPARGFDPVYQFRAAGYHAGAPVEFKFSHIQRSYPSK